MLVERPSPHWSSTGLTPFLGRPVQCGYFYTTPTGERLTTTYDLACNMPHNMAVLQCNRVSNLEPSCPKAETFPLGHRGLRGIEQYF
ncbi:hypothetical protein AVEN_247530-1 [Araneus ventricosus]|uniref:Uncharacterized protein n=1 Tax=Araneus ventricosus TaxID=182803 RepID=A0A4Y2NW29_ARAVE|nr:hypothetical protein AVEN_79748-1 [Araneus ventricosus]GBN43102.1 hypothetical protein AVEN_91618-1 [Araneus ventricosus]GBN48359.1 hypothetical protein AVEN_271752-1 [Araneus ventricosus]GBN48361.1 hypothetical protein AVEN_247530-1 [Araneus ventricosus]